MGQMDRDYWRKRYNNRTNGGKDPTHWREDELEGVNRYAPVRQVQVLAESPARKPNELGFLGKFVTTIAVCLISAIVYRYMR